MAHIITRQVDTDEIEIPRRGRGTRWRIFETSVILFAHRGVEAVSVRDISDRIDLSVSSLYNHFPSKESIVKTMYAFYRHHLTPHTVDQDQLADDLQALTTEEALFRFLFHYPSEYEELLGMIMQVAVLRMGFDEDAHLLVREYLTDMLNSSLRDVLEKLMEMGRIRPMDVGLFVKLFTTMCYGISMHNHSIDLDDWKDINKLLFSLITT